MKRYLPKIESQVRMPIRQPIRQGRREERKRLRFEIAAEPGVKVYLVGSFNEWQPLVLEDNGHNGKYERVVALAKGVYEYKFNVNNNWVHDLTNPRTVINAFGSLNSVIEV